MSEKDFKCFKQPKDTHPDTVGTKPKQNKASNSFDSIQMLSEAQVESRKRQKGPVLTNIYKLTDQVQIFKQKNTQT